MRICDFKIFSYSLPLVRNLPGLTGPSTARKGFIIVLTDENNNAGYGETAPLTNFSIEMPEVVLEQVRQLKAKFTGHNVPANLGLKGCKFSDWLSDSILAPSVRFGFESAVLSLKAASQNKTLAGLIDADYQTSIAINGLLDGSEDTVLKDAQQLVADGFQTLKLKIGRQTLTDDIKTVNRLTQLIAGKAILRLDANQSWDIEQAIEFSKNIDFTAIEYIEEPLKDFLKVPDFFEETLIPVAIDESLKHHSLRAIKSLDGVEMVILKPTLLGGFEKIRQMAEEAHSYGLHTVMTSAFESGIGLRALANLAACYSKHSAVGLDTQKWFSGDVISTPLKTQHGRLPIEQCQFENLQLDPHFINEIL